MASVKELPHFDAAKYLDSSEAIASFMSDAMKSGDAAYIASAFGIVARAKGVSAIAEDTGLSREHLYRSFSDSGNPTLKTLLALMKSLHVELSAQPATSKPAPTKRGTSRRRRAA